MQRLWLTLTLALISSSTLGLLVSAMAVGAAGARRRGLLTQAWPFFRSLFGEFDCSRPVTSAMAKFLEKAEKFGKARPRGSSRKR